MYNELYIHLADHNILFSEQFGFWDGHLTDHAVIDIVDEINGFMEIKYTLVYLLSLRSI